MPTTGSVDGRGRGSRTPATTRHGHPDPPAGFHSEPGRETPGHGLRVHENRRTRPSGRNGRKTAGDRYGPLGLVIPRTPSSGSSVNAGTCVGRTTRKWRLSSVATWVMPMRSASATTDASAPPRGRSAYCSTKSADLVRLIGLRSATVRIPLLNERRNAASWAACHLAQLCRRPRHDKPGDQTRSLRVQQHAHAAAVMAIVAVGCGDQRTCVAQDHRR